MPREDVNGGLTLEDFAAEIIVAKGMVEENRKALGRYGHEIVLRAEEVVRRATIDALSAEQAADLLQRIKDGASDEEIEEFFETADADYEGSITMALRRLRQELLAKDLIAESNKAAENKNREHDDLGGVGDDGVAETTRDNSAVRSAQGAGAMKPVQGTTSEVQGASDVEGKILINRNMTEEV